MRYDTTKTYPTREEAEKVAETLRPLAVGDIIKAKGITRTLTEVQYSDIFIEYTDNGYMVYFMCEFNANGNYGYYKSVFDGGVVELSE